MIPSNPFRTLLLTATFAFLSSTAAIAAAPDGTGSFETMLEELAFEGRVEVGDRAVVSNSVNGTLSKVLFTPGEYVEEGQPLLELSPTVYRLKVRAAEADVTRKTVELEMAVADLFRTSTLHERGRTTEIARADADHALRLATANLSAAEAALEIARTELGATVITAPISGYIDGVAYSAGSYVKAETGVVLTEITQLDPVLVSFSHPYESLLELHGAAPDRLGNLLDSLEVNITLPTGERLDQPGRLVATGNALNAEDSSLTIWAEVPNPETFLIPGLPVAVDVTVAE
ncbi:efflux RND transporter periplasmic adaptor subunit [Aliiruegeria lutimaris]|uniref:Membrane fusion protein, multidrug efflux system n=1 Tax=Aliiruegeria lutimaris TaxID=571298 RepID=A0A1G9F891_9RHOB|nr:efflux RND transporter periplasmic adaptor subunit [Aliiruegeria lutimaris]SDK84627.1 membrane fusion protein, multidrug efflux system [Aliiruegeria lutimaris]